jgi:hypothetical protein
MGWGPNVRKIEIEGPKPRILKYEDKYFKILKIGETKLHLSL